MLRSRVDILTTQVDQRDQVIETIRKSYEDRISKLKAELERLRQANKQLMQANNALQTRMYDGSMVEQEGVVGELLKEKAGHLMMIDELRMIVDRQQLTIAEGQQSVTR